MSEINFAVHAPSAEVFWQSWITAGICTAPHEYTAEYRDHIEVRDLGSGQITSTTLVDGEPVTVTKPGYFCNVRCTGSIVAEMTYSLAQVDEDGNRVNIFDATWAVNIFGLEYRDRDPTSNFPQGYVRVTPDGDVIAYSDMADIATPYEVRQ